MEKELQLYIHIPFCIKKCAYCDFLSGPQNQDTIDAYVEALMQEVRCYKGSEVAERKITTVFFGGGTPSVLTSIHIRRIFEALREVFVMDESVEITIEANPGTIMEEKLEAYKQVGINRISFGLQSANNDELQMLGRIHTFEEFLESYQMARAHGFDNINVDLISAIPGQTVQSWENTLQKVIELQPEHISAYSLIIEEGTPFAEVYGEGKAGERELPSEEEERTIYHRTKELLRQAGYHRYEISNYAQGGRECKHNLGYWERKDYLGLGLGSASLVDNVRYKNTDDLNKYIAGAERAIDMQEDKEELTRTQQMEEFVFLGLRKMQGISLQLFESTFGRTLYEYYGANIAKMQKENLVIIEDGYLRLTEKGIDISNYVFGELLS